MMTGYASATLSLLGPLHLILELRYLSHELVQAILQIKALLLVLVPLLLGLLTRVIAKTKMEVSKALKDLSVGMEREI